jgi:predicted PurR-regulated permease PerM
MLLFVVVLLGVLIFSAYQINLLMEDLPSLQEHILQLFEGLLSKAESSLGIEWSQSLWKDSFGSLAPVVSDLLTTTSSAATVVFQIPIYTFLIMLYKERFRRFFAEIYGDTNEAETRSKEVKEVVQNYVLGLFIVILILAVLNSLGLWILGVRYALFFGVFSALLTVIPYLGNFIGGLLPFLVALVTKDSAWYAIGVIAVYAVIQFLEGNFITPNIMGHRVSVNPLAALLSLIIGGQVLGLVGVVLAIPAVGILKTALMHSTTLRPFVILIEDEPPSG